MDSDKSDDHHKNDKTYVWVKLRDGSFDPHPHKTRRGASDVTNRKRGAPASGSAADGDVWGWAPGYYCPIGGDGGGNGAARLVSSKDRPASTVFCSTFWA